MEDRDALVRHYREMQSALLSAIEGLSDEAMAERSLDGWSVADHLLHVADWDDIRATEVARVSAGYDSAWRTTGDQDEAYSTLSHDLRLSLSPAQTKWELATSTQRLLDAISQATERGLDGSLYGEAGLRSTHRAQHTGWIKRWREERNRA